MPSNGFYIYCTNGRFYNESTYNSSLDPVGIAVIHDQTQFIMALDEFKNLKIASNTIMKDMDYTSVEETALSDFNGRELTNEILMMVNNSDSSQYSCASYLFKTGNYGYLPSIAQLNIMWSNIDYVNQLLTLCGGTELKTSGSYNYYCSSKFHTPNTSSKDGCIWVIECSTSKIAYTGYSSSCYVRPVVEFYKYEYPENSIILAWTGYGFEMTLEYPCYGSIFVSTVIDGSEESLSIYEGETHCSAGACSISCTREQFDTAIIAHTLTDGYYWYKVVKQ